MRFIGIDPGASGGVAWIEGTHVIARKMPETEKDIYELFLEASDRTEGDTEMFAIIEKVHSSPQMGVTSSFSFGKNYGMLRAFLTSCQIPFDQITPQTWQKAMGCMSGGDKNVTKAKAQQLFPKMKVTHAIADSLLIAQYCQSLKGRVAV